MRRATWRGLGFETMDQTEVIAACEKIFAVQLQGAPLLTNAAPGSWSAAWINFRRIRCERWHHGKLILLGDAAHTAHFSIGSGTKLALEDAIKLAEVVTRPEAGGESVTGDEAVDVARAFAAAGADLIAGPCASDRPALDTARGGCAGLSRPMGAAAIPQGHGAAGARSRVARRRVARLISGI